MKDFRVLPSSPDFQNLTDEQLRFMIAQYNNDSEEQKRSNGDYTSDANNDWWEASHEDFDPIEEGHDEEDIARQAQALFDRKKSDNTQQVEEHIAMRLQELIDTSKEMEATGVANKAQLEEKEAFERLGGTSIQEAQRQIQEELPFDEDEYI